MADISIKTNGTIEGTSLIVDGKEISKKDKITRIDLYAMAPYVSEYSGETIAGQVAVSYDKANEDGTIERKALISGQDRSAAGIGQKIKNADQVVRYIDQEADSESLQLIDHIINHSKEKNLKVPTKEDLLNRSVQSLRDKCNDLGIQINDDKE